VTSSWFFLSTQKVEGLLGSDTFVERNKTGSHKAPTNKMNNFLNLYLIFNFCCLLHVSNLVGSSSERQLYMQYGMLYMHRCEQGSAG